MTHTTDLSSEWAITSFTPWESRLNRQNIWDIYRRIRQESSAVRSDAHDNLWVIGRYRDVKSAASDHKRYSSASGIFVGFEGTSDPRGAPIEYDPPDHARFRTVMAAPFRPRSVNQFIPLVKTHIDRILSAAAQTPEYDIVHDIAEPLSVSVMSDIIGFDASVAHRNRELALALVGADHDALPAVKLEYLDFIATQVSHALSSPSEGMLGDIARFADGGRVFTPEEVCSIVFALAVAGHHTTINGISSMLLCAADRDLRDRWIRDYSDPRLIAAFVEETLRIDPPIHLEARRTTEDVDVGGVLVPAGAQVALLFGSANHDEEEFEDPELFNATRGAKHLAFGHGIHTCLGMALARLEMVSLLGELLRRFPDFSLVGSPEDSGMVFGHHMGWNSMPARLT